ncbi:MAG: hypothetical protein JNG89_17930 [Planctomycetaceae bacterium]|nr:hypothetical protein [Planctomycetaceae bacterium]
MRSFVRAGILYAVLAGGVIWTCEHYLGKTSEIHAPMFWLSGHSPWAPDESLCPWCGGTLVARVDSFSACRHCEHCQVSFRHRSLPKTIEDQESVWR